MKFRSIVIACVLTAVTAAAHAQDPALERVQNLINTGRLTDARRTLTQWERAYGDPTSDATSADRARAIYLSGVLSTEPKEAENAFLNVVLSYPSSEVAPDALLRLGQGLYSAGDHDRAIEFLERLQSDYPPSTARETGILWLARAQLADGAAAEACGTTRDNLAATSNPNLRMLIEIERDRACAASGGQATRGAVATRTQEPARNPVTVPNGATPVQQPPAAQRTEQPATIPPPAPTTQTATTPPPAPSAPRPSSPSPLASLPDLGVAVDGNVREPDATRPPRADEQRPAGAQPAPTAPSADTSRTAPARDGQQRAITAAAANVGEFGVQIAAFSQLLSAQRIVEEMKAKGLDARIVTVPGSGLYRVRYGAFASSRDAAAAALHIRDAGFATLIVNDVRLENRH